jgi:DNA-binding NtrC family response regulator
MESSKKTTSPVAGQAILLVEDEIPVRNVLQTRLTKEGFTVFPAGNGREGLALAEAKKPDLVLLDIVMPEMDGMTMLRQMRQTDWGKNMKVVMLTNLADADRAAEAGREGVYDFLIKSNWQLWQLVALIKKKLQNKA